MESVDGMRLLSSSQLPRSIMWQRSEQNGRHFCNGLHSTGAEQVGQETVRGAVLLFCMTLAGQITQQASRNSTSWSVGRARLSAVEKCRKRAVKR